MTDFRSNQPNVPLEFKRLHAGAFLPQRGTFGASGFDMRIPDGIVKYKLTAPDLSRRERDGSAEVAIPAGSCAVIEMGFAIHINDPAWEAQVRARSGLATKNLLIIPNGVGTIDSDYQGDVCVALLNLSSVTQTFHSGDRIAQLVFCPVGNAVFRPVEEFSTDTERGTGGFGSTGVGEVPKPSAPSENADG